MSNGGILPQEIVTDILSRLPVKSLCRFKCVSPSWKTLISDPYFAKAHLNRTSTNNPKQFGQNILLRSVSRHTSKDLYSVNLTDNVPNATKLYIPSLPQPKNRWADVLGFCKGSCDGLFLFSNVNSSNSFLLNPSTRECKKLPPLPFVLNPVRGSYYHDLYGVGYDSFHDEYKVVKISSRDKFESKSHSDTESFTPTDTEIVGLVAVYSLRTNAWRRIQDTHYRLMLYTFGVYFNGGLHWLCSRGCSNLMVAFDLADEIFREVPLPALLDDASVRGVKVAIVGDCLCLVYVPSSSGSRIEVWTMKEYGVGASWTKIIIDIDDMNLHLRGWVLWGLLAEDEFLLSTMRKILPQVTKLTINQLVVYNPKKGTLRNIVIHGTPTNFRVMATYVESLVSPNQCPHGGGIGVQG